MSTAEQTDIRWIKASVTRIEEKVSTLEKYINEGLDQRFVTRIEYIQRNKEVDRELEPFKNATRRITNNLLDMTSRALPWLIAVYIFAKDKVALP